MSQYQPFFQAFLNAFGGSADQRGSEFVPWIGRQWRAYFVAQGQPVETRPREDDFPGFTAWLTETHPEPAPSHRVVPQPVLIACISCAPLDGTRKENQ